MQVLAGRKTDLGRLNAFAAANLGAAGAPVTTAHFSISALPAIGQFGPTIAQAVSHRCEADRSQLENWFSLSIPHFDIVIAPLSTLLDGTGGAYHATCSSTTVVCDAKVIPTLQPARTSALAVAEMVEVYEDAQAGEWNCGRSNGEGLSRVLAAELYPGVMDDYAVASAWLSSFRPDYVNVTGPSDTDTLSVACSVIFLNYLHSVLNYSWGQICQCPAATLAGTYQSLTGDAADPFPHFRA